MTLPSILTHSLLLALGGGIGTLGRVGLTLLVGRLCGSAYPWGTLAANLLGSCAFGAIVGAVRSRGSWANGLETILMAGVLGGFTPISWRWPQSLSGFGSPRERRSCALADDSGLRRWTRSTGTSRRWHLRCRCWCRSLRSDSPGPRCRGSSPRHRDRTPCWKSSCCHR